MTQPESMPDHGWSDLIQENVFFNSDINYDRIDRTDRTGGSIS